MVDASPWPLWRAGRRFCLVSGILCWFSGGGVTLILLSIRLLLLVRGRWWVDVSREGCHQGLHTRVAQIGLRWGIVLFIVSECFFFLSFFWAFFHRSLSPSWVLGGVWPPLGLKSFSPVEIPLLNTLILLRSGVSVTWAHHALLAGDLSKTLEGLGATILLGAYFTFFQGVEYYEASFRFADSVYGSTFFIATGFHGLHVLVGTLFLVVSAARVYSGKISPQHHFGFEAAAWYWHFVDVVWLILYCSIYCWSSSLGY